MSSDNSWNNTGCDEKAASAHWDNDPYFSDLTAPAKKTEHCGTLLHAIIGNIPEFIVLSRPSKLALDETNKEILRDTLHLVIRKTA